MSAQPAPTRAERLARWLVVVDAHKARDPGAPAVEVSTWPGPELDAVVTDARQHARTLGRTDAAAANQLLLRGASLHADIARLIPDEQTQRSPKQVSVHTIMDGRWVSVRYLSIHWRLGRELLDAVLPEPSAEPRVREWYRETSDELLRTRSLAEALPHLTRARQIFPADPRLLFLSGVLHERLSSPALQAGAASVSASNRGEPAIASPAGEIARAERFFRLALEGDPAQVEARVRRGNTLGRLGRHREAIAELRRAAEAKPPEDLRYLAHLILAREWEAVNDLEAARIELERAAALFAQAQTPRLALSHLARRMGDRQGAQRELQALAALPADESRRKDPWWQYYDIR